ncbi:hypothetical protein B0H14DRAFT_3423996 [Mycena olivaceomarginata]|nr:hypothetical protein B0H14DRAFT_3423996 [Mycena olivaceomarginata]
MEASHNNTDFLDSAQLNVQRVRVSVNNFVALAQLSALPPTAEAAIKLVSIPRVILSVAMRDTALEHTDLAHIPVNVEADDTSAASSEPEKREGEQEIADNMIEILDSDEEDLANAHSRLSTSAQGVIDLSDEL